MAKIMKRPASCSVPTSTRLNKTIGNALPNQKQAFSTKKLAQKCTKYRNHA